MLRRGETCIELGKPLGKTAGEELAEKTKKEAPEAAEETAINKAKQAVVQTTRFKTNWLV
jgi:hypothetical protein